MVLPDRSGLFIASDKPVNKAEDIKFTASLKSLLLISKLDVNSTFDKSLKLLFRLVVKLFAKLEVKLLAKVFTKLLSKEISNGVDIVLVFPLISFPLIWFQLYRFHYIVSTYIITY